MYISPERIPRLLLDAHTARKAVLGKQIKFQSESLTADLCLGVAIAGVNTLIVIGLFIVFA